jgi:hypothetical protein
MKIITGNQAVAYGVWLSHVQLIVPPYHSPDNDCGRTLRFRGGRLKAGF